MKLKPILFALPAALLAWPATAQLPTFQEPPVAVDQLPLDPTVVEVHLTADDNSTWQFLPGVDTPVWAYNGSVPGPTIKAEVGQLIRVVFTNNLAEPTTIHWHGVETTATMDGSHISQLHVQPGETFTYEFTVERSSLYWYHPHVRTHDQIEKGLYGALLIEDPALEARYGIDFIEEKLVIFDDILLDGNNQIVPAFDFGPNGATPDPLANALYHVNGREGNVLLVNGKEAPVNLPLTNGQPIRLRVVNTANTTFARLDINDFGVGLWEFGTDGGFTEAPFPRLPVTPMPTGSGPDHPTFALLGPMGEGIFLMPGERLDVVFTPLGDEGQQFMMHQNDWRRGRHTAVYNTLGQIMLPDDPMDGQYPSQDYLQMTLEDPNPGTGEYVPPTAFDGILKPTNPVGNIPIQFGHGSPDPLTGDVVMFAQAEMSGGMVTNPLPSAKITSLKANDVFLGHTYLWEVTNLTHGDHPFHTHGFFFVPLTYEYQDDTDPTNTQLNFSFLVKRTMIKDTFRTPARGGLKNLSRTITRCLVTFDDTGREGEVVAHGEQPTFYPDGSWVSGGWLVHCHVLEHAAKGMLSFYELHDETDPFRLLGHFLPGTNGNPYLTPAGDLSPGSAVQVTITNALPFTQVILRGGTQVANEPFAGGVLVPNYRKTWKGTTDVNGEYTWSITEWNVVPTGTTVGFQAGFQDPGGPQGWALSNAFFFRKP